MLRTYQIYIIKNFLSKFVLITLIFFSLTIILGSLEEISFSKDLDISFLYPYFLTLLNAPITLFEIFPFIFLLTTQFLFYDLFKKDELSLLKTNGLNNTSIIKIIFLLTIILGLFNVVIFYNIASNLKFHYSNLKNNLSNDNKYLAMVTKSGLWIKDEIGERKLIIKSNFIKDNFISDTIINEFDKDFDLIRIIQSEKIDIKNNEWIIYNPIITKDNLTDSQKEPMIMKTNFNHEKINNLFSNISTLDIFKLFDLKEDYERLGYSSDEIFIQLLKLSTTPLIYGILTILSAIIMFGITKNSSIIFHITIGFLISVLIYYLMFFFTSLGNSGKIPVLLSVLFPIMILSIISTIGLININEK
jgi:lipopolysaccharide export system permease protein